MGLSTSRSNSLDIISLRTVQKLISINPMSLSDPWSESLGIISLNPVKRILWL